MLEKIKFYPKWHGSVRVKIKQLITKLNIYKSLWKKVFPTKDVKLFQKIHPRDKLIILTALHGIYYTQNSNLPNN